MKTTTLIFTILITAITYAQNNNNDVEKVSFTSEGLSSDEITVNITGMDKEALFNKSKEWIEEKYGTLDVITKEKKTSDQEDQADKGKKSKKIVFKGFTNNAICFGSKSDYSCFDSTYEIEIKFVDDEYKFKIKKFSYAIPGNEKDKKIKLKESEFHTKEGNLEKDYEKVPSQIEGLFNGLNKSLFNFLTDREQETEW